MPSAPRVLLGNLLLAGAYAGLGWLGLSCSLPGTNAAPLWPAAGLALAALWRWGPGLAPGVAVGSFLANLLGFGLVWWAAALTGLGAAAAAVAGRKILQRSGADLGFPTILDVCRFATAALAAAAVAGLVGSVSLALATSTWAGWNAISWTWFSGDAVGILTLAPLLALPLTRTQVGTGRLEIAAIAVAVVAAPLAVFSMPGSGMISFLALPPLVWAALRLGPVGAATAIVAVTAISWGLTAAGLGPIAGIADPLLRGSLLQAYLATAAAMALLLGASTRSRELAIRERAAGEERYRLVAENARDLICLHNLDGTYRWVSPSARPILGYTSAELVGRDPFLLFHPDDGDRIRREVHHPLLPTSQPATFQVRFRNAQGGWVWLEVMTQVVRDATGVPVAIQTVSRDVTQRRADEEALEQARRSATMAERMAAIGTLAGGVAHEFNNLNAVILGNVELTLRKGDLTSDIRRRLEMIREAVERERGIVDALLTFSHAERGPSDTAEIGSIVATTIALVRRTLRQRQVTLHVEVTDEAMHAKIPGGALGQILLNLLLNACDAIDRRHHPQVWIHLARAGHRARLSVRDNGVGIRPEDMTRIFLPFFSTKGEHAGQVGQPWLKGTGLGLSVCQTLVDQIGGTIEVESSPDAGATFTVTIPLVTAPAAIAESVTRPSACARILVVDDEPEIRRLLAEHLAAAGHVAVEAEDGQHALERLAREEVDLVLLNWNMPGIDGEAFLKHLDLHPERRWPPVVVVSGWTGGGSGIDRWRNEIVGELRKPFSLEQVRTTVHSALHGTRGDRPSPAGDEDSSLLPGP